MELVFEEQSIDYLRRIFSGSAAQELTQELIVPDSYPDCGRIVFTGACAVMRGKECRDGGAAVTGGVRAGLLYVPEDGLWSATFRIRSVTIIRRRRRRHSCLPCAGCARQMRG